MLDDLDDNEFYKLCTNVPDHFKLALADLIINFARIEVALDRLIWWAAHLPNRHTGRVLTARLDIRPKTEIAKALLNELPDQAPAQAFNPLLKDLEEITKLRNTLVHGWWMVFGDFGVALSTRLKQERHATMEGGPFKVKDLLDGAETARAIEQAILRIVGGPAPSPQKYGC